MQALGTGDTFLFGGFRLDRRGLFRRDEREVFVRVAIGARALDVLCVLVAAGGDLISKHEMMAAVWPGIVVEDNNLTVQMSALRRVLDHGRADGSCIQTVAGRGYRLVVPVTGSRQFRAMEVAGPRPKICVRPHWPQACRPRISRRSLCCRLPI